VSPGFFFAKKPSNFSTINSQSSPPLSFFAKKALNFTKINPQSRPFKWASLPQVRACISPDVGLTEPNLARRRFSIFLQIYYLSKTVGIL
jgi:hypothetical protein